MGENKHSQHGEATAKIHRCPIISEFPNLDLKNYQVPK